jgi:hypothetical protein
VLLTTALKMRLRNVHIHGLHLPSQLEDSVDATLELIRRADHVESIVIDTWRWLDQCATSLGKEVVRRSATVANDELMSAFVNWGVVDRQLLAECRNKVVYLLSSELRITSVARDRDWQ